MVGFSHLGFSHLAFLSRLLIVGLLTGGLRISTSNIWYGRIDGLKEMRV